MFRYRGTDRENNPPMSVQRRQQQQDEEARDARILNMEHAKCRGIVMRI